MEHDVFCALHAATSRRLWAYVRGATGDADVADELTQEAYVRMLTVRDVKDMTRAHQENYLFRLATNLIRDHYRRSKRIVPLPSTDSLFVPGEAPLAERQLVEQTLVRLRPADRELLWLAYVEGATHQEIAAATGFTAGSVRPLLHKAKVRAREILRGLLDSAKVETP
jgi:RNA polymerase sigma-70 factor (ECF subfamily)